MKKIVDQVTLQAMDILSREYDRLNNAGAVEIRPDVLAQKAYRKIDTKKKAPPLAQWLAQLELRQMARLICRRHIDGYEESIDQGALFDGQLQPRYPATRNGEETYVKREFLALEERLNNVARLRKESIAKARHADALEAETDRLKAQGYFKNAA